MFAENRISHTRALIFKRKCNTHNITYKILKLDVHRCVLRNQLVTLKFITYETKSNFKTYQWTSDTITNTNRSTLSNMKHTTWG